MVLKRHNQSSGHGYCRAAYFVVRYRLLYTNGIMSRFLVENETVIDKQTGLMWAKNASLYDFPMSWDEALNTVKEFNHSDLYGYNDWKLPNRKELISLISHETINPSLPIGHPFTIANDLNKWT